MENNTNGQLTPDQVEAKKAEIVKLENEAIELATKVIKSHRIFYPETREPISVKIRAIKEINKELGVTETPVKPVSEMTEAEKKAYKLQLAQKRIEKAQKEIEKLSAVEETEELPA